MKRPGALLVLLCCVVSGCTWMRPVTSSVTRDCAETPTGAGYEAVRSVGPSATDPLASVCHLTVRRWKGGVYTTTAVGTGFLIGDDVIVTAAHNVHSLAFNWIDGGVARCGRHWDAVGRDTSVWDAPVRFTRADVDTGGGSPVWFPGSAGDYAVVRLAEPAPYRSPFRLLSPDDAPVAEGERIYVAGHPGNWDPDEGGARVSLCTDRMHRASGAVAEVLGPLFSYAVETRTGNSGGPVWVDRGDGPVVVGVHIERDTFLVDGATFYGGRARRVDARLREDVVRWRH